MGIYDYLILSEEDQWNTLWDSGQFVTHLKKGNTKYTLYAIDRFYVEVELGKSDKIVKKKVFRHGHNLDKYAPKFDINFGN